MPKMKQTIESIPIQVEHRPSSQRLHISRRMSQYFTLFLLIIIPLSGLFRIDPAMGAVVMLDYQIWFSDIAIVMGFWIFSVSLLVVFYSVAGSVFCGWMCPQNTVSEWANYISAKLLGRKAEHLEFSSEQLKIAVQRGGWLNITLLFIALAAASLFYALIPLLYFYPPAAIWSFITFQEDFRLADSLHWIYFVCAVIIFLDVTIIRHLLCKYMCVYRVWQHSFKTKDTLKVVYDRTRSDDCANCHYCVDSCFLDIDPRKTEVFDSCVNCGECIVACDHLHEKSKKMDGSGLLRFAMGAASRQQQDSMLSSIMGRTQLSLVATLLSGLLLISGIMNYQAHDFTVYRSEAMQGAQIDDYRVNIAHKRYHGEKFNISVQGLDATEYTLATNHIAFDSVGRKDVNLTIASGLSRGIHRFSVTVQATDGWSKTFPVQHYSDGKVVSHE
ncbi:MAG: 4Fe-4S binding protein [Mariprofundaceae bacterium]|nr:4Fe-4S binding protein [Mariprofundaceae bacterium]